MNLAEENVPQFMTIAEVAQRLKVTTRTIYTYMERADNPLPVIYLSDRTIRVPWDQFNVWIDSMQENEKV